MVFQYLGFAFIKSCNVAEQDGAAYFDDFDGNFGLAGQDGGKDNRADDKGYQCDGTVAAGDHFFEECAFVGGIGFLRFDTGYGDAFVGFDFVFAQSSSLLLCASSCFW